MWIFLCKLFDKLNQQILYKIGGYFATLKTSPIILSNSDRLPPHWEHMLSCSIGGLNQMWILKHSKDMLDWKYLCCVWRSRIPMGTNCALLLADLFLYSYEADFKQGLLQKNDNKQADPLISRSAV